VPRVGRNLLLTPTSFSSTCADLHALRIESSGIRSGEKVGSGDWRGRCGNSEP